MFVTQVLTAEVISILDAEKSRERMRDGCVEQRRAAKESEKALGSQGTGVGSE